MNDTTLTPQSQVVADAIAHEQEGLGCSFQDIVDYTELPENVVKGHLSDLFKKDIIMVLLAKDSGLSVDLYSL